MAWTTTIKDKQIENGVLRIHVEFTQGDQRVTDTFLFDGDNVEALKRRVAAKIARLDAVVSLDNALSIGQVVDVTPAPVVPTEKETWLGFYNKLVYSNQLIANGVITNTHPDYVNLLNKVKADFKVSFV